MKPILIFVSVVALCGGPLALSGCHSQANEAGVAMPAAHSPSVQEQMQDVDKNPHIPDAQKAAIKASIANGGGATPAPAAPQTP